MNSERIMEFRVGVVVLASLIIAGVLVLLFSDVPSFQGKYTIEVSLPYARGVAQGTPVRKSGIHIGTVEDVRFADKGTGVIVKLAIDGDVKLTHDEVCQLRTTLLGDAELEFMPRSRLNDSSPVTSPPARRRATVNPNLRRR